LLKRIWYAPVDDGRAPSHRCKPGGTMGFFFSQPSICTHALVGTFLYLEGVFVPTRSPSSGRALTLTLFSFA
jgi:hypothetical protein